jgi:dynein assembly factor 3
MSIAVTLGHHGFWGYSTFFDWNEALNTLPYSEEEPINILLVNPGDIRHIMATVARRRRANSCGTVVSGGIAMKKLRPIHFYLLETPMEVLARDVLLLEILNDYEVPIRQRANIFLEIFGNAKVQDRTSRYVEQLGHELRKLIDSGSGASGRLEGIVDLQLLKYREKDELEDVFKSYSRANMFDIDSLRDHRLRGFYQDRYDSRNSMGDWDWHSHIKHTAASIIHVKQFKEWRMSGIAFEFGDQVYDQPNRTMMSYTEGVMKKGPDRGLKKEVKGFWGDIVVSPYISFGIDTDTPNKYAQGLFEILNKVTDGFTFHSLFDSSAVMCAVSSDAHHFVCCRTVEPSNTATTPARSRCTTCSLSSGKWRWAPSTR